MLALGLALAAAAPDAEAVRAELNRVRADPAGYARELKRRRAGFERDQPLLYREPGDPIGRWTREGAAALDEAIVALRAQPPLVPLAAAPVLTAAAADHVVARGPTGAVGHRSAGLGPAERARARGGDRYLSEAIGYGQDTAASLVRALLIDDGVPGRGHRLILLPPRARFVGIACGPHRAWRTMCVLDLSASADATAP